MAGRGGGAGYWGVLGAGEGHCWVHEAEEGVSGVPLHLSQSNTTAFHKIVWNKSAELRSLYFSSVV